MADKYTFPSTPAGEALRTHLAESLRKHGFTVALTEEDITHGSLTFHILVLTKTGKRPGEGAIAAAMKENSRLRGVRKYY